MPQERPDAISEYIASQRATQQPEGDAITQYVRGLQGPQEGPENAWGRFLEGVGNMFQSIPTRGNIVGPRQILVGAGTVSGALLHPLEGLLRLPEVILAGEHPNLITNRAADYVDRASKNLRMVNETLALMAGLDDNDIKDAYMLGDFIGMVAPITASVKMASWVAKAPLLMSKHIQGGSIVTDWIAGAIFGGLFDDSDTAKDRMIAAARESAIFGVGRIMFSTLGFTLRSVTGKRTIQRRSSEELQGILRKLERGEPVEIGDDVAMELTALLSEEGYVSSSIAAQEILARNMDESALVQAIVDVGGAKASMGVMTMAEKDFVKVTTMMEHFRSQFPHMKFDVLRNQGGGGYDIYFGSRGLSPKQKAQLKNPAHKGRFEGQAVYRLGDEAQYEYLGRAKRPEWIRVRRSDGTVTELMEKNTTTAPFARETIASTPDLDALYKDFWRTINLETEFPITGSVMTEMEVVQGIRDGTLQITNEARRAFTSSGIVFPEEIGAATTGADDFVQNFLRDGVDAGGVHARGVIPTYNEMFDSWARAKRIPKNSVDYEATRAFFATEARRDLWKLVPEEDKKIFDAIRAEQEVLIAEGEIPFEAVANSKGFFVDRVAGGRIELRDINTGFRLSFGSEVAALNGLKGVVRTEGGGLGGMAELIEGHGMGGFMGGFRATDGTWRFPDKWKAVDYLDDIPAGWIQNTRDHMRAIEDLMGGPPLFTQGFNEIDTGLSRMRNRYEPWAHEIEKTWKRPLTMRPGKHRAAMDEVISHWVDIEGAGMDLPSAVLYLKDKGLSNWQVNAFRRSHAMYDAWYKLLGLPRGRYINLYFSRIRPYAEKNQGLVDIRKALGLNRDSPVPAEFQFWAEMSRTGELGVMETDPRIVMHKYIRSLLWMQEVKTPWDHLSRLTGSRTKPGLLIKDMPKAQQAAILKHAPPGTPIDDPVLSEPLRRVLQEYLATTRGVPNSGLKTLRDFGEKFFRKLGVDIDPRVMDEYYNTVMSCFYGAAMGLRMSLVGRNAMENIWTLGSRLGYKMANSSLERAMTQEGFDRVVAAGSIRFTEAGIPYGDAMFQQLLDRMPRAVKGPMSHIIAAPLRWGLRGGYVLRKTTQKFLIPYSGADDVNRAWAHLWQEEHTLKFLTRFEEKAIPWEKFLDDGLPFYSPTVRGEFTRIYNNLGQDEALKFIGKMAADESNYIYGVGAQQAWMQTPFGRMAGMFGTWPMWALELYKRRMMFGTTAQKMAFITRTASLVGAIANMTLQTGTNLWSWIAPTSIFGWSGGPTVDHVINMKRIMDAPLAQKGSALAYFSENVSRLALPGQVFFHEVGRALNQDNPMDAGLLLMLGRPVDIGHYSMDYVFDVEGDPLTLETMYPENMRKLDLEDMPSPYQDILKENKERR